MSKKQSKTTTLRIDTDTHKSLKIASANIGVNIEKLTTEIIREGLKQRGFWND